MLNFGRLLTRQVVSKEVFDNRIVNVPTHTPFVIPRVCASTRQIAVQAPSSFTGDEKSLLVSKFYGQATKGKRWMPWHIEAMKDVASCDKLR